MTPEELDDVAAKLWVDRQSGDHAPSWLANRLNLDDALAIQVRLLRRYEADGAMLAGWKVGLTSERARQALGADVRPFGFVTQALHSPVSVATADVRRPSIEPEFVFTVGQRLGAPDVTAQQARAAMASVAAGYELNEQRNGAVPRPDLPLFVTDRLSQWAVVEGAALPLTDATAFDPNAVLVRMRCNSEERLVARSGDELDDHWSSLARLAMGLHAHGLALEPGQKVITGALGRFNVEAGEHWLTTFEGIGDVEVRWT